MNAAWRCVRVLTAAAVTLAAAGAAASPASADLPRRPLLDVPDLPYRPGVPSRTRPLLTPTGPITALPRTPRSKFTRFLPSERRCPGQWAANAHAAAQMKTMICMINFARKQKRLPAARMKAQLRRSARLKAQSLILCGEFSHTPCGQDLIVPFRQSRYATPQVAYLVGENLAWGSGRLGAPRMIMLLWLKSPPHRANIFRRVWADQGVYLTWAQFAGRRSAAIWVSHFGRRAAAAVS